jgi:hypothetical protein
MRKIAAILSLVILVAVGALRAEADDADTIAAINPSSNALDEAFAKRDVATIKALMTQDHVTVTPYYGSPQSVDDQLASLADRHRWFCWRPTWC